MPALPVAKLDEFARLVARGFDPQAAAIRVGYPELRRSRTEARLALPDVGARIAALAPSVATASAERRPAGGGRKAAPARATPTIDDDAGAPPKTVRPRPDLPPPMTEEERLAEYAPHLLAKRGAPA